MRSRRSLRQWVQQLLPTANPCAHLAAWELLRALLLGFTVELSQLVRQLDRACTAKSSRRRLARWLAHEAWPPLQVYAHLLRLAHPVLTAGQVVPLLIDATTLADGWYVLQVSVPFQGRALPLFRAVRPYQDAAVPQAQLLAEALAFLSR